MAESSLTRRGLIEAGGAAAGGVVILGLPESAEAAQRRRRVGSGPTDRDSIGLLMGVRQVGPDLVGFGYFTRVRSLDHDALFVTPPALSSTDPRASDPKPARLTFYSEAKIESLSQLGAAISSTGAGVVRIYFQADGGADFADPASFGRGVHIATMAGQFQNDLTIIDPDVADVNMTADLTQSSAKPFATRSGRRLRLGGRRFPWAFRATGRGIRTDPATPRSELTLSGTLGVVDARRRP